MNTATQRQDARERGQGCPSPELVAELVRRVRSVLEPSRIVLFGSAARGTMGPDSDLDVLVVAPAGTHRIRTAQAIYRALSGLGHAADIVVVTEEDVRRDHGKIGSIVTPALEEGRDLYAAPV